MKVGDLVRKNPKMAAPTDKAWIRTGIVVEIEASERHYKVCWGEYGTFWTPWDILVVVSESR